MGHRLYWGDVPISEQEKMVVMQGQLDTQQLANRRCLVAAGLVLLLQLPLEFHFLWGQFFLCMPRLKIHFLFTIVSLMVNQIITNFSESRVMGK